MKKRLQILISVCMIMLMLPMNSFAASTDNNCSLTIQHPSAGVEFQFYKIAEYTETGTFEIEDTFRHYVDEITNFDKLRNDSDELTADMWRNLSVTLENYVITKNIACDYVEVTDEKGYATVNGIEAGYYLVLGDKVVMDGIVYLSAPILIATSGKEPVVLKYSGKLSTQDTDEYTVVIIWNDDEGDSKRPEKVRVTLFRDRRSYDSQELSEENNWQYTWTNLPEASVWHVEQEVPDGYTVDYIREEDTMILEYEKTVQEDTPGYTPEDKPVKPGGTIAQTGQLWWPVPILATLGIVFYAMGWIGKTSEER